tara:strand:- start:1258 stop:1362 length:105 start_codon:yes stop_codon:yes gene_type:complete
MYMAIIPKSPGVRYLVNIGNKQIERILITIDALK